MIFKGKGCHLILFSAQLVISPLMSQNGQQHYTHTQDTGFSCRRRPLCCTASETDVSKHLISKLATPKCRWGHHKPVTTLCHMVSDTANSASTLGHSVWLDMVPRFEAANSEHLIHWVQKHSLVNSEADRTDINWMVALNILRPWSHHQCQLWPCTALSSHLSDVLHSLIRWNICATFDFV